MRFAKSEYTETEAAKELGISVHQFRALVRIHVLQEDDDTERLSTTVFQRSDVLLLRLLLAGFSS
ncbi:MAG TPA: hypothetical protein VEV85_17245 [Bryobacteraceae bacterium]|nr:hypothetical protein [Bryobacteraceae bacterium]